MTCGIEMRNPGTRCFVKVLVAANSDQIVGFTMIGSEAGER
jgi:pyruvate/2-oxoglutarate dehydrogenase complex dihydrolipoamide dehydrogenase (E3) component